MIDQNCIRVSEAVKVPKSNGIRLAYPTIGLQMHRVFRHWTGPSAERQTHTSAGCYHAVRHFSAEISMAGDCLRQGCVEHRLPFSLSVSPSLFNIADITQL
jgi:hypothetical protein